MENTNICSSPSRSHPTRSNPELNLFHSVADEIVHVTQERAKTNVLSLQRAHLGRRLNELQPSTSVLPPEMLADIFEHLHHNSSDMVRILSVCFHWRQTALSTPHLWTELYFSFPYSNRKPGGEDQILEDKANLLQLWLTNVRGATFTLELMNFGRGIPVVLDPFVPIFGMEENAEKIRELYLYQPQSSWIPIITRHCVNLEKLEIHPPLNCKINLKNQPHLRTFSLQRVARPVKFSPTLNITTLTLKQVSKISICFDIISQCRHSLINLHITSSKTFITPYTGIPITFDRLQSLRLDFSKTLNTYISNMKLPALENLTLDINLDEGGAYAGDSSLFKSLPCVPITLTIMRFWHDKDEEEDYIQECYSFDDSADQIQEVVIIARERDSYTFLKFLSQVNVIPHLRRLFIDASEFMHHDTWVYALLEMLETRRPGVTYPLELRVHVGETEGVEIWRELLINQVARLVKEGCQCSISFTKGFYHFLSF